MSTKSAPKALNILALKNVNTLADYSAYTHTGDIMYNQLAHSAIDSIQSYKKNLVSKTITHDNLNQTLNSFIDAQTAYTKAATDAGITCAMTLANIFGNKKFYEDLTANYKFK